MRTHVSVCAAAGAGAALPKQCPRATQLDGGCHVISMIITAAAGECERAGVGVQAPSRAAAAVTVGLPPDHLQRVIGR